MRFMEHYFNILRFHRMRKEEVVLGIKKNHICGLVILKLWLITRVMVNGIPWGRFWKRL